MKPTMIVAFAVLLVACGSGPGPTGTAGPEQIESVSLAAAPQDHSIEWTADNGNRLALVDGAYGGTRLSEQGSSLDAHRTTPVDHTLYRQGRYVDFFASTTRAAIPPELWDFQARHSEAGMLGSPRVALTSRANQGLGLVASGQKFEGQVFPPIYIGGESNTWCGNGCCDENWMLFACSQNGNTNPNARLLDFNYGYEEVDTNSYGAWGWYSLLCPIAGAASSWQVDPDVNSGQPSLYKDLPVGQWMDFDLQGAGGPPSGPNGPFSQYFVTHSFVNSSNYIQENSYCVGLE